LHPWLTPTRLTFSCILFSIGLLVAGLWPFNFRTDNHAYLIPGGGLKFDAPAEHSKRNLGGMVFTPNPLACRPKDRCEAGALTIQVQLSAESETRSCLKRIVELRRSDGTEAFFLGQWKSSLIVRSFNAPLVREKLYREIGVGGVLSAGRTSLVTIVSGLGGTDIHLDGQLVKKSPGVRLLKEDETLEAHKLYLGNSRDLSCGWSGSLLGFGLFGKAVEVKEPQEKVQCVSGQELAAACYRFDNLTLSGNYQPPRTPSALAGYPERQGQNGSLGDTNKTPEHPMSGRFGSLPKGSLIRSLGDHGVLAVQDFLGLGIDGQSIPDLSGSGNDLWKPAHLVFEKPLLSLPDSQSYSFSDLILNLLGFMPLGFLLYLRLFNTERLPARICLLCAVAVGFALSLGIEVTQVWLPGRDSSLSDLIANTVGTAIGGLIASRQGVGD
jgi:VanZ family protein